MAEALAPKNEYDFRKVLNTVWDDLLDYMKPGPVLTELLKEHRTFRRWKLRDLEEKNSQTTTTTEKCKAILQLIKETSLDAYSVLKRCLSNSGQNNLVHVLEAAEMDEDLTVLRERLKTDLEMGLEEENLHKALQLDLVAYYREHESTMPVAPLAEQHEAEITNFYVRPPMIMYHKPVAFGQDDQTEEGFIALAQTYKERKQSYIKTYRQLFFNNREPLKKIYVTADAGMGKTSFSKMLAMTWCQAHLPDSHLAEKFDQDDLETMKSFEVLFLIHLRAFSDKGVCSLDDMIMCMLTSNLPKATRYSKEFVEQTLCDKSCLIIVDGLDEWIHPEKCHSLRSEIIPHNKDWRGCSVLTTTRPWKLSIARLSAGSIDRHVEISKLDEVTSKKLTSSAIEFLNENRKQNIMPSETQPKRRVDFEQTETVKHLDVIRYIPYILLQMICLWFEDKQIGKSLCEVYSNIIELILTRWLVKTDAGHKDGGCECYPMETVLNCMKSNTHCRREMALILKIAKLAFFSLFSKEREKTLLFDWEFVSKYLDNSEIKRCLTIGLLSQVKDSCTLSSVRFIYFFPHKSIQEFFTGVHIALNWDECARQIISNVCISVSDILEMSDVFVFVCGMNPKVYSSISCDMSITIATDPAIEACRSSVLKKDTDYKKMNDYQSLQMKCLKECKRNGHLNCPIVLQDVVINETDKFENFHLLKLIISSNSSDMKSLFLSVDRGDNTIYESLSTVPSLKKLFLTSHKKPSCLHSILSTSAPTLKYLCLHNTDLTDNVVQAMTSLCDLQGLGLENTSVSCDNLQHILTYLSTSQSMRQLCLSDISCSSSKQHDTKNIHVIQLAEHKQLQHLVLHVIDVDNLYVNPESLTACKLFLELPHSSIKGLFEMFKTGTMLTELKLHIFCIDHPDDCLGFTLDLSRHTKMQQIHVALPHTAVYMNTSHLLECIILSQRLFANNLLFLLNQLHDAPELKELSLRFIRDPPDEIVIPSLPQMEYLGISFTDLGDTFVTLPHGLGSLESIVLDNVKMSIAALRKLFLNISSLPQKVKVVLCNITLTSRQWRELLFDIISKLPNPVNVIVKCRSIEREDWEAIVRDLQSSCDIYVKSVSIYNGTDIELEVESGKYI